MPLNEHKLPGHVALLILQSGLLPEALATQLRAALEAAGHGEAQLAQPDSQLPLSLLARLLDFAELPGGPDLPQLAVQLGERIQLTSHGLPSLLLMTAATVREATQTARYVPLLTSAATLDFIEGEEQGILLINPHSGHERIDLLIVLYVGSALGHLLSRLTGRDTGLRMQVAAPCPAGLTPGPGWQFNAAAHALLLPRAQLDLPIIYADPVSQAVTRRACDMALAQLQREAGLSTRISELLESSPAYPSQDDIARRFNMSTSTLKRHLAEEGSQFAELLQQAKRRRAVRLLLSTRLSCQEIADQLGFSSQTNFTHAFKKWLGVAPSEFRHRGEMRGS